MTEITATTTFTKQIPASELTVWSQVQDKNQVRSISEIDRNIPGYTLLMFQGGEVRTYRSTDKVQVVVNEPAKTEEVPFTAEQRRGESYPTGRVWAVIRQTYIGEGFDRFQEFGSDKDAADKQAAKQNAGTSMGGPAKVVHRDIPEWSE